MPQVPRRNAARRDQPRERAVTNADTVFQVPRVRLSASEERGGAFVKSAGADCDEAGMEVAAIVLVRSHFRSITLNS